MHCGKGEHREERLSTPLRRYLGCGNRGLYYNRHRYYAPEDGRYLLPDPIALLGDISPQAYVHNPLESTKSICPEAE
ncbi:RHS repeat-associated core domain-containing protein [Pectobacterium parmentieri]|nr:RHS repeat-associated core domain-containing protein [Pectobacterium parmentieri]